VDVILHKPLWHQHPHVRSGEQLSAGEIWADRLKRGFGTWWFLGALNALFLSWVTVDIISGNKIDPGLFYANLFLSWLAGQQGGALQIAANRGDRISSEVALATHKSADATEKNSEQILTLTRQQMTILAELRSLRATVESKGDQ
jgi:uncharacterized membrane protein